MKSIGLFKCKPGSSKMRLSEGEAIIVFENFKVANILPSFFLPQWQKIWLTNYLNTFKLLKAYPQKKKL